MSRVAADHDLLFGILALQNGLVEQAELIAAFQTWTKDRSRPLAQVLVERGALTEADRAMLDGLVRRHVEKHGGDTERSLAAAAGALPASAAEDLRRLGDPAIEATLGRHSAGDGTSFSPADGPPTAPDMQSTVAWSVGEATSAGGRFRILRPHAKGGIGLVSVALDAELHREVALKEIQPEQADDPASRARFLLDAELTGRLEHPGVAPVYGLGTNGQGRPYYAMRFVRGESLREAIARFHKADADPARDPGERRLALRGLLARFLDVCNAVAYAHSRGVIHRDIKPANILLGPYGETLLVDWGLAKVVGRGESGQAAEATLRPPGGSGSTRRWSPIVRSTGSSKVPPDWNLRNAEAPCAVPGAESLKFGVRHADLEDRANHADGTDHIDSTEGMTWESISGGRDPSARRGRVSSWPSRSWPWGMAEPGPSGRMAPSPTNRRPPRAGGTDRRPSLLAFPTTSDPAWRSHARVEPNRARW